MEKLSILLKVIDVYMGGSEGLHRIAPSVTGFARVYVRIFFSPCIFPTLFFLFLIVFSDTRP